MSERSHTPEDLDLFVDLDHAARATGLEPCLIGAGAIQLGPDLRWNVRLARRTNDWDFAVRVESWEHYEALARELVSAGFQRSKEPHRFRHRRGGLLDVLPYGSLERPPGSLEWPGGVIMSTLGLSALDGHHAVVRLAAVELRAASIPAIVGLKVLAYLDRRPGIVRDIQDVHALLQQAEACVPAERIAAEALDRLNAEDIAFSEVGAYLLGRDVGATFLAQHLAPMTVLLDAVGESNERTVGDVQHSAGGAGLTRKGVLDRLRAFRLGIQDG